MIVKDFIIIGGGIAGLSSIKAIREENKTSSILWISDEDRLPYKRTKINKNIADGFGKDDFALIDHEWLVDNHIELLYDEVENINTDKKELSFAHRGHIKYNKLIIATGNISKQFNLEGLDSECVFNVRTARQVENIIRSTANSKKYLVIGAGVEGVETAEQLVVKGKEVVLVDRDTKVLKRFFNSKYSLFIQDTLQKAGVKLILDAKEIEYSESPLGKPCVMIGDDTIEFDIVITTIGYTPNIKLAAEANIKCRVGVLVDEFLQTSAPDVYAAGDVAEHPSGVVTGLWHAAEHQGKIAGLNACGKSQSMVLKPFRMKTEVFDEFYFSVLPKSGDLDLVSDDNAGVYRDMYFKDAGLEALLMKNDGKRAKVYQQALMEKWTLSEIKAKLPL